MEKQVTVLFVSGNERNNNYMTLEEKIKYCCTNLSTTNTISIETASESTMLEVMNKMKVSGTFDQLSCIILDDNFVPSIYEFCEDQSRQPIGGAHPGLFRHEEALVKKHSELCEQIDATYPGEDIKIFAFGGWMLPTDKKLERVEYLFTQFHDRDLFMAAFLLGKKGASHIKKGLVVDNNFERTKH